MKFKFPLQKVLEHRKIQENLRQKDFQDAVDELNKEKKQLDKMLGQVTTAHGEAGRLSQAGGNPGAALAQIHDFLKGQEILIKKQRQKVQESEKLVEAKRELLRQAAVDYKIIEKMRENKFAEYRHERLMDEQKENDEQSILRFKVKE